MTPGRTWVPDHVRHDEDGMRVIEAVHAVPDGAIKML